MFVITNKGAPSTSEADAVGDRVKDSTRVEVPMPERWPPEDESLTWRASSERNALYKKSGGDAVFGAMVGLLVASVLVALGTAGWIGLANVDDVSSGLTAIVAVIITLFFFGAATIYAFIAALYWNHRAAFYQRVRYLKAADVHRAVKDVKDDMNLSNLVVLNRRQLDEYHVLSVRQATISFRMMQWAGAAAFLVLILGVYASIRETDTTAQITTAALSGLGTTLSAFISSVFFKSYRATTEELKTYYLEPMRTGQLLAAERICSKNNELDPQFKQSILAHILSAYDQVAADTINRGETRSKRDAA